MYQPIVIVNDNLTGKNDHCFLSVIISISCRKLPVTYRVFKKNDTILIVSYNFFLCAICCFFEIVADMMAILTLYVLADWLKHVRSEIGNCEILVQDQIVLVV